MDIAERLIGNVTVLDLGGRMTFLQGDASLRQRMQALIERGSRKVLINLAGLDYVDSAGLGELVHAQTEVVKAGGRLKLAGPNRRMRDLLSATRLLTVLETFDDESQALRSFEQV